MLAKIKSWTKSLAGKDALTKPLVTPHLSLNHARFLTLSAFLLSCTVMAAGELIFPQPQADWIAVTPHQDERGCIKRFLLDRNGTSLSIWRYEHPGIGEGLERFNLFRAALKLPQLRPDQNINDAEGGGPFSFPGSQSMGGSAYLIEMSNQPKRPDRAKARMFIARILTRTDAYFFQITGDPKRVLTFRNMFVDYIRSLRWEEESSRQALTITTNPPPTPKSIVDSTDPFADVYSTPPITNVSASLAIPTNGETKMQSPSKATNVEELT